MTQNAARYPAISAPGPAADEDAVTDEATTCVTLRPRAPPSCAQVLKTAPPRPCVCAGKLAEMMRMPTVKRTSQLMGVRICHQGFGSGQQQDVRPSEGCFHGGLRKAALRTELTCAKKAFSQYVWSTRTRAIRSGAAVLSTEEARTVHRTDMRLTKTPVERFTRAPARREGRTRREAPSAEVP